MNLSAQEKQTLTSFVLLRIVFMELSVSAFDEGKRVALPAGGRFHAFFRQVCEDFKGDFECLQRPHFNTAGDSPYSSDLEQVLGRMYGKEFSFDGDVMNLQMPSSETKAYRESLLKKHFGPGRADPEKLKELVERFEQFRRLV